MERGLNLPTSCRLNGLRRHFVPPFLSDRCLDEATHRSDATLTSGYTSGAVLLPPSLSSLDERPVSALRSSSADCLLSLDLGGALGQTLAFAMEPPLSRPVPCGHVGVFSISAVIGFASQLLEIAWGPQTGCYGGFPTVGIVDRFLHVVRPRPRRTSIERNRCYGYQKEAA